MKKLIAACAVLFVVTAPPAWSQDKAQMEKIIEEYILNHPEVLDKSLRNYYTKKKAELEKAQFTKSLQSRVEVPIGSSPSKGPDNAPITLVEFSDFQCPYCARSAPTLKTLEKKYEGKIRFVFKHFPLTGIHNLAIGASKASMAAGEQGKFWEYHDMLMARQGEWGRSGGNELFDKYASSFGLDMDKFASSLKSPDYGKQINQDIALGRKVGVKSTPTFFVNGVMVRGARSVDYFSRVIDFLLNEKK